jgi:feruloyl-CoA synthase
MLRANILSQSGGYAQDAVIAGHDREFAAALVFPDVQLCRGLCPDVAGDAPVARVLDDPRVLEQFRRMLRALAAQSTGSSTFVARAILLDVPPSIDAREITDKGSLNHKAVLHNRSRLVDELYAATPSSRVIAV